MFKKFNMFALIVLLVLQTMIAPITATAQGIEAPNSDKTTEDMDGTDGEEITTDEEDVSEVEESSENEEGEDEGNDPDKEVKEEKSDTRIEEGENKIKEKEDAEDKERAEDTEYDEENMEKQDKSRTAEQNAEEEKSSDAAIEEEEQNEKESATVEKHGFNLNLGSVTDLNGNPYGEDNLLEPRDEFKLKLDWNLTDGHGYEKADTETFNLPKGIKITEEITGELKDEFGAVVATYIITTDKKVELTFTDFVETHSNVKGWIEIISTLDEENVEIEDGEAIIDPISDEGEIRIPIEQGNKEKTIEKKGTPNKGYNANEINWEVTINKNKTSLTDAKVADLLPEGTEYKEGSLKVTKLKVDLYGNILGDAEEVDVTGETVVDSTLTIPLGDIKDAYRIEYVTTVIDDEKEQFKNNAILSDNYLEDISANATITINRGEAIKKKAAKGYDPKTGIIEWEIEFNYNEKDLSDVTLTDVWTPKGKMDLVEDSLKFTEVEIDENGNAHGTGKVGLPNGAELVKGEDKFDVTGITTNKSYKVTYQTKVKDRVLDGFNISNTAGFGIESSGAGTGVGTYYGSKSAGTIDYKNKTIDWKIELNHDEYSMKQISITDTLGKGLTLKEETINITVDGADYSGQYTLSGDNPFTIEFPKDFKTDKQIEISYQTKFVADHVPEHKPKNKAAITWTPGSGGDSITKEVEAGTELNKATKDSSWKNGSYNPATKEITWNIITNYRQNSIDDLNITDAPQGNQQIVPNSVKVHELTIDGNGNHRPGDDVTSNVGVYYNEDNTFSVGIGKTQKAYFVEYKTSLAGLSDIQKEYENKAEVLDGTDKLSDLEAKVGIAKSDTYGEKSGYQEGKQIHWSVKVNLGQQEIHDLKLKDTISDNQDYLVDTFKVYHATIDGNGNASKGDKVSPKDYVLTHTPGEQIFTVKWIKTVDRAFIVEYSTLFFERHGQYVTNTYKVTGDSISRDEDNASGDGSVSISQLSSGGGSGEAGYLVIDKIGKKDGVEAPLAGAEFDLIDPDTKKVLKSGTTDENGHIDFGRLLFGTYELHERVVPGGYVTLDERQTIEIDQKYEPGADKESFYYEVLNFEPVFAIELSKTDNDNNVLSDAEFTLFDSGDNEIAKATTDKDGKILFEDLENPGIYYVQETKAPAGYVLNETNHEVTIGDKEEASKELIVKNTPRGAVHLTKKDKDTNKNLEGVKFVLQKTNDSGGYSTVKTYTTDENGQIKTSNKLEAGNYQFVETQGLNGYRSNGKPIKFTVKVNSSETQEYTMTNEKFKGSVKLIKSDAAKGTLLPDAEFKLVDSKGKVVKEELVTTNKGEIIVSNLLLDKYQLIETKAPNGYELDETPIDVEITEDLQVVEKTMTNNKITNVSVEKKWNNAGGKTKPVTVKLLPTDKKAELNEDNDWKATFKDLQVYDDSGKKINYEVEELDVEGYKSTITGGSSEGFIVTNTELTSVSGTKNWLDDNASDRPEFITVKLLANEQKTNKSVKVTGDPGESKWSYKFDNLEKYDEKGKEIVYTVDEVKVDGYKTSIKGFDITNLRVGTISVEGEKTWKDENPSDRPGSIDVNLSRKVDGIPKKDFSRSENVEPDKRGKWIYEFKDLEEFDENGIAYTYTIEEENVPDNYKSTVDGYNITNVRIGETEVSGTKRWKDDKVGDRPDFIKVNLLRNDVVVDKEKVSVAEGWKYTFAKLDKYDDEGQSYRYTVKEQDVKGYNSEVNGKDITNTRSEQKSIEVTKGWLDDDSKDRPESVIVYLKQNDKLFDTVEVKADKKWKYEFDNLESYDKNGQPYDYTVEEKTIDGYKTTVDGFDITNLRVGETKISGTKKWLDDNSKNRPMEITVKLLANGVETDKSIPVTEAKEWKYEFTNLDKYDSQGKEIEYSVDEETVKGYEKSFNGNIITNLRIGETEVTGEKKWNEVDDRYRPDSITVQLLANGEEEDTIEISDEIDWSYEFTGLDKYDDQGKEITYTVEEPEVPNGYTSKVNGYNITNTQASTEINGEKTWVEVDNRFRPDAVTVQLFANDEKESTVEISEKADWKYKFTDLAKYDKAGKEINYTIEEVEIPAGYESEVKDFDITNTQKSTKVKGEKIWDEVDDRYRPDTVTVQLLANGEKESTVEVSNDTGWIYEFSDLATHDKVGKEIDYTVEEIDVPAGYDSQVKGFDITNTQKVTEVIGEKIWNEVDNRYRPDTITVQLLANGEKELTLEVSGDTDWTYEFTSLAKYDATGKEVNYTVEEIDVPKGYESEVDDNNLINTQKVTNVTGTKIWLDDNSKARPNSIAVQVKNGNEIIDEKEVTAEDKWEYTFTDLAKYDKSGKEISYTIDEKAVDGYEKSIEGNDITNLRVGPTELDVTKLWKDENEKDRPDTIKVNLIQNGDFYKEYEVTKENDWKLTIKDLQRYDKAGKSYKYTVKEHDVVGYKSEVDGLEITNTRADKKTIEIAKSWLDNDSKDRPDTIEVDLYRSITDGELERVDTITVKKEANWSYEVKDLPLFDTNGKSYTYEINEKEVDGYETSVNGFELTNLRVGETEVKGTKTWLDDDSVERPDTITVKLLANGEKTDKTIEVSAASDWTYVFTNLDKYDDQGKEIAYSVDEKAVDGYEKSIEGNDITNLRVGTTEVEVTKLWKDEDEKNRPDTIKVNLLQNGDFYKEYEVTSKDDWKLIITDLPQYDETGKAYGYSVTEHDVAGYASEVDEFEITNTRTDKKTIEITKTWLDDESKNRPDSIEVELFRSIAEGEKELVETIIVSAADNWAYVVVNLPVFDADGKAYTYEINEEAVDGYESVINGFDITNVRVGATSVGGTKTWKDDNSKDRPTSIVVELLQNGENITEVKVTAETDWKYSFIDLAEFDANGAAFIYTVKEQEVAGYSSKVNGYDITNTLIPVTPGPKNPEDPKDPEGADQSTGTKTDGPGSSDNSGEGGKIPKTATNLFNLMLIGLGLLSVGLTSMFVRRKKTA